MTHCVCKGANTSYGKQTKKSLPVCKCKGRIVICSCCGTYVPPFTTRTNQGLFNCFHCHPLNANRMERRRKWKRDTSHVAQRLLKGMKVDELTRAIRKIGIWNVGSMSPRIFYSFSATLPLHLFSPTPMSSFNTPSTTHSVLVISWVWYEFKFRFGIASIGISSIDLHPYLYLSTTARRISSCLPMFYTRHLLLI